MFEGYKNVTKEASLISCHSVKFISSIKPHSYLLTLPLANLYRLYRALTSIDHRLIVRRLLEAFQLLLISSLLCQQIFHILDFLNVFQ